MDRGAWGIVAPFHPPALVTWEPGAIAAKCDEVCERLSSTCFLRMHGDQCIAWLALLVAAPGGVIRLAESTLSEANGLAVRRCVPWQPANAVAPATA